MGIILSIGQGRTQPRAMRVDIGDELAPALEALPADAERWWSGHLWTGDYRSKANWEASSVVVLDLDHYDDHPRHAPPPIEKRRALEDALATVPLASAWHHTPRGARIAWSLPELITDAEIVNGLHAGAAALASDLLEAAGVRATLLADGRPANGYGVDARAMDAARLVYAPRALVDGVQRQDIVIPGSWSGDPAELLEAAGRWQGTSASPASPHDDAEIAEALAKLPCIGDNDGSLELMRVCRKALGLGIDSVDRFLAVSKKWNERRLKENCALWSDHDLMRRFEDAHARYEMEGLAKVPLGSYSRASLQQILATDRVYAERFQWDVWRQVPVWSGTTVDDPVLTMIEVDICYRYGYRQLARESLMQGIRVEADRRPLNPIVDYLVSLPAWDGRPRIRELAETKISLVRPDAELAATYLRKTLISAVARAINPGCKVDQVLVLIGPDGVYKSSLFRLLTGPDHFLDTTPELNKVDGYQQIHQAWIYEWAELSAITRRTDMERVKALITSQKDVYRAPYDRVPREHLRRGIFVASSNRPEILTDPDSNRRWWPVEVERPGIDLAWVELVRDQIWAEALHAFAIGEPWHLTPEEETQRRSSAVDFTPDDPFLDSLHDALGALERTEGYDGSFRAKDIYLRAGLDPIGTHPRLKAVVSRYLRERGYRRLRRVEGAYWARLR